jgi:hypothetical protein
MSQNTQVFEVAPSTDTFSGARQHALPKRHARLLPAFWGLSLLALIALVLGGCGATSAPHGSTTPTTVTGTAVNVYFARHPDTDNNPTAVVAVQRTTSAATIQARATFALEALLQGPTAAERSQGLYSPFDGHVGADFLCQGASRNFDLTLDHRGTLSETGTATVQFCRNVTIAGDLDGPRMSTMIGSTLMQFSSIKRVVILNADGRCFDDLQGQNACLNATPSGYAVVVYFSKHPESDSAPTSVFAVKRVSPTLGVATYGLGQLLAGPTPAEKAQGYYTPLEGALSGASTCNGADFTITLNWNRTHPETGTATLQFCRAMAGLGDTGTAMAQNEIVRTLMQFSSIKKVVILMRDGSCFNDLAGCL